MITYFTSICRLCTIYIYHEATFWHCNVIFLEIYSYIVQNCLNCKFLLTNCTSKGTNRLWPCSNTYLVQDCKKSMCYLNLLYYSLLFTQRAQLSTRTIAFIHIIIITVGHV